MDQRRLLPNGDETVSELATKLRLALKSILERLETLEAQASAPKKTPNALYELPHKRK